MTGKGDRWGRDRLGRSAPAFLSANMIALPPPTCTARREAGRHLQLLFRCEAGHLVAVCYEACAGRRVRWLCLPAVPVQQAVCLYILCLPCPLPSSVLAPVQFVCFAPFSLLCLPCSFHVRQDRHLRLQNQHVCKLRDCPVGSNNAGQQWRPAHRVVSNTPLPVLQDCLQAAAPWRLHLGSPCAVARYP